MQPFKVDNYLKLKQHNRHVQRYTELWRDAVVKVINIEPVRPSGNARVYIRIVICRSYPQYVGTSHWVNTKDFLKTRRPREPALQAARAEGQAAIEQGF